MGCSGNAEPSARLVLVTKMTYNMVMIKANIAEVKAHFSSYVRRARAGEVVVVCERNVPVVELRRVGGEGKLRRREPGFLKDLVLHMDEDAFAPMSDEEADEIYNAQVLPEERLKSEGAARHGNDPDFCGSTG